MIGAPRSLEGTGELAGCWRRRRGTRRPKAAHSARAGVRPLGEGAHRSRESARRGSAGWVPGLRGFSSQGQRQPERRIGALGLVLDDKG